MTTAKKLKKLANDVDFIDPETMKKVCSLNQCINKFDSVVNENFKSMHMGKEVTYSQRFYVCNQCGRKYMPKRDKQENNWEKEKGIMNSYISSKEET